MHVCEMGVCMLFLRKPKDGRSEGASYVIKLSDDPKGPSLRRILNSAPRNSTLRSSGSSAADLVNKAR